MFNSTSVIDTTCIAHYNGEVSMLKIAKKENVCPKSTSNESGVQKIEPCVCWDLA